MSSPADLKTLATFAATMDARKLPAPVMQTLKACLLNGLAVGIGTIRSEPAKRAMTVSGMQGNGNPTATRFMDGAKCGTGSAAFANAVLLSGRAQGDSHLAGHMGGVVIPVALAAAEENKASGIEFLSALVAGYEVSLRIGRDHFQDLSTRGFRTTPCYGVFGSATVSSRMKKFDAQTMANAIALSANFAGGLRQYVEAGTEESPFQAGFAARNGLTVAELASCGVEGASTALHGDAGFYRAYANPDVDYGRRLVDQLGTQWEFTNVTYKDYPACQICRGVITGLAGLRNQAEGAEVKSMELRLTPYEANFIGTAYAGPFSSAAQTLMSAPFCAALAWQYGTVSYQGLRNFDDRPVLDLVKKTKVIADESRKKYEPKMRVTLANGRVLECEGAAGDSNYRLTWEAAQRMAHQLGAEVDVPEPIVKQLIADVSAIEDAPSTAALIATVVKATTGRG